MTQDSENNKETAEENASSEEKDTDQKTQTESGKQFQQIIDGTARIGQSIGQAFKGMADIFTGRDYVVMVRVNKEAIDRIDELVESSIFKSRSESAAYLIAKGIQADAELFNAIDSKVSEISRLKDELREMVNFGGEKGE